ncbi:MAG: radical SAM family heme chaperone HemW [Planctomycetes bacterium]|nr:radical SAM family heme chaperone HemW [Planctomycetota bacterium]
MIKRENQGGFDTGMGLYLHWPFCETKCGYCDFYSVPLNGRDVLPLLDAVATELQTRTATIDQPIDTVFWGGGTPTTLSHNELAVMLGHIQSTIENHPVREFTIEANPATLDDQKAAVLVDFGVTRVSIGAQSFHPSELTSLERLHEPRHIAEAVATIRQAGIRNYNIDLIFGIGGQTLDSWKRSLALAVDLEANHLACYGLTYETGTALTKQLKRGLITACDEQLEADMLLTAKDFLERHGYEHYEISNFAKPGYRCEHNLIYWHNGSYIGVGPSAAGCFGGVRYKNIADINEYVRLTANGNDATQFQETINPAIRALEALMMRMRLIDGLDLDAFTRSTGVPLLEQCRGAIARLTQSELIEHDQRTLRMTRKGLLMADTVIRELASEIDTRSTVPLQVIADRQSHRTAPT